MEKNVDYFAVEPSADGAYFTTIGSITTRNQSNGADYTFTDLSAWGDIFITGSGP